MTAIGQRAAPWPRNRDVTAIMSALRLWRKAVVTPSLVNVIRTVSTNAANATALAAVAAGQTADKSSSSAVAPVLEGKDVPLAADIVSGAPCTRPEWNEM